MMMCSVIIPILVSMLRSVRGGCGVGLDETQIQAVINQPSPQCSEVNLLTERLVCQVTSADDTESIEKYVKSICQFTSCTVDEVTQTCQPVMTRNTLEYKCHCGSSAISPSHVPQSQWTNWQKLDKHFREFIYTRKLVLTSDKTVCLAEEFNRRPVRYIVSYYNMPDSVFSASSEWKTAYGSHLLRFDLSVKCGWISSGGDSNPWISITLPGDYVVLGVLIVKGCDEPEQVSYVRSISMLAAGTNWMDVVSDVDISDMYSAGDKGSVTILFPQPYTNTHWRMGVNGPASYAQMQCDLVGFPV